MTEQPADLTVVREQPPALSGFATASPALTLARGKAVADAAAPVIHELNLVKRIGQSAHVYFDGWTMVGAMVGVFPVTVRTWEIGQDEGYGANVEARTLSGEVVGAADAIVMRDEQVGGKRKWLEAPAFQVASMAQTRAGGKALRQPLGWIMRLAGYEATPAEEMDEGAAARGETVSGGKGVKPGWRDVHDQTRAHQRLDAFVAEHGLGEWVGIWLDSKGYTLPMSKQQMSELRRAVDRELAEREQDEEQESAGQAASAPADPAAQRRKTAGPAVASAPPGKAGPAPNPEAQGGVAAARAPGHPTAAASPPTAATPARPSTSPEGGAGQTSEGARPVLGKAGTAPSENPSLLGGGEADA